MKYLVKNKSGCVIEEGDTVTDIVGREWLFEYVSGTDYSGAYRIVVSHDGFSDPCFASAFGLTVEEVV